MSIREHIEQLKQRHSDLDKAINEAQLRPSTSSLEVAELKRKKLRIKDKLDRVG